MTDPDNLARQRFFILSGLRIGGVLIAMAGFALIAGRLTLVDASSDRIVGAALVLVGMVDFALLPMLLARRWRSPDR